MKKIIVYIGICFFIVQAFAAERSFVPVGKRSSPDSDSIGSSPRFHVFSPKKGVIDITEIHDLAKEALAPMEEKQIPAVPERLSPTDKDYDVQLHYDRSLFKNYPDKQEMSSLSGRVMIHSFSEGECSLIYPDRGVIIWKDRKGKTIAVKLPTDEEPSHFDIGHDPVWVYYAKLDQIEKGRGKKARLFLGNKKANQLKKRHIKKRHSSK